MTLLYLLPHAGGAAHGYAPLKRALEPAVEVVCLELPGRGKRAREAPVRDFAAAVQDLRGAVRPPPAGRRWAVFGHSMGALLGHALVHAMLREGAVPPPAALIVSGTAAPAARRRTAIADLPKEQFWEEVQRYGGVPAEILEVPDFRDYFEAIIRADFAVLESEPTPAPRPVPVPIHVLHGHDDMTEREASSWEWETSRAIALHGFPGGHFYLFEQLDAVAATISRALLPGPGHG